MSLGPGALSQSGSSQGLHSQGSLSDAIGSGLPPPSLMQGQIGNGEQAEHQSGAGSRQATRRPAVTMVQPRPCGAEHRRPRGPVQGKTCRGNKALILL